MANILIAATNNGNFTTNTTWHLCDATSALDVETANTALTTSYVGSSTFAPGAIVVDGIAVKIRSRSSSPSGTMSVELYNSTASASVAGTEVTINVSDIGSSTIGDCGWFFFKFASPVTLLAATNYTVRGKTSSSSQVNIYRNSTAGNWCRLLRTTTDQAPAAGDKLLIAGEWTAAATKTDITVTMDNTDATDFGTASTTIESLGISKGGTLTWGTTASTAYNLRLSGLLKVYDGGAYNMGTTGTPMPSDSTAKLEFDCAADGDFGLIALGASTVVIQGASKTADRCLLNTDEAIGQTVLGVDTNTGWVSGDEIGIASTSQTRTECEKRTVDSSNATTVTVTVGLTNAHSGTSPTQADVILITRNVKICSVSSSSMAYFYMKSPCTVDADWVEFYYIGTVTTNKQGLQIDSANVDMQRCSVHDAESYAICPSVGSFTYSVLYNVAAAFYHKGGTINNNIIMLGSGYGIETQVANATYTYIKFIGLTRGISASNNEGIVIQNCEAYSNSIYPFFFAGVASRAFEISNCKAWRNLNGIYIASSSQSNSSILSNIELFGNATSNIIITGITVGYTLNSLTLSGDSTFATASGIDFDSASAVHTSLRLESCSFGVATGIKTAHTQDINGPATDTNTSALVQATAINCVFGSAIEIKNYQNFLNRSFISSAKHDQTKATHKTWLKYGVISLDSAISRAAAPSLRMTPNNASNKLESAPIDEGMKSAVDDTNTVTVSVYVRKSVAGDGAAYNGNQPRLILRKNNAAGISADTVLDTMTAAAGEWEQLTGTTAAVTDDATLEFVVDCDGTAGWVNVDDWSVS